MTTKHEQERRNFEHTLEVLFASAMAERDLVAPAIADNTALWGKRRNALVAASVAVLILVPAAAWFNGRLGPRKAGPAPEQLAMAGETAAEVKTSRVQVQRIDPLEAIPTPQRAGDNANALGKVRVIPIAPGEPAAAAGNVPARSVSLSASGVMLEDPPLQAQAPMQPQPASVAAPPLVPSVRVASSTPAGSEPPASEAPAREAAVSKMAAPKVKQAAAPIATSAARGNSGFVAVLASKKSRMDALKVFADLQQKYAGVLGAKTPDVQEANLGDKGVWYRVVVGPPGSRESASDVCTRLKAAGHSGCWVAAH